MLFIAGQLAIDKAGKVVGKGDLRAQAVQVLENIRAILVANKADMKDIVQVTVYVTDMRAFHDIADIRMKYFPKDGPSSVIVEVSKLAIPGLQIEISAIAAVLKVKLTAPATSEVLPGSPMRARRTVLAPGSPATGVNFAEIRSVVEPPVLHQDSRPSTIVVSTLSPLAVYTRLVDVDRTSAPMPAGRC